MLLNLGAKKNLNQKDFESECLDAKIFNCQKNNKNLRTRKNWDQNI